MHWHLIHTKPRQEQRALQNLEMQGYQCYLPLLSRKKISQAGLTITNEALFPRYLFIQLDPNGSNKSWSPIRSTQGVSCLVSFGSEPAKVNENLVNLLKSQQARRESNPEPQFKLGEKIQFTGGAFAGLEGVYQMASGDHRVMVLIELLSKPIIANVPASKLRKVD